MTYSGAGHVAQPKTKLSSSKNELPNHPIETNEEMHQKLKLDRTIHLEKYEIFFNAYVPGLYIGLGMAIRWSMTIPEPAMYSPVSSSKNELPSRPIALQAISQSISFQAISQNISFQAISQAIRSTSVMPQSIPGNGTGTSIFQPIHSLMQIQVHCDLLNMLGHHTSPITLMMDPGQALKDVRIRAVYHKAVTGFCITI